MPLTVKNGSTSHSISINNDAINMNNSGIFISNYDTDPDAGIYNQSVVVDGGWGGFYFSTTNTPYDLGNNTFAVSSLGAISVGPRTYAQIIGGNGNYGVAGQVLTSAGGSSAAYWSSTVKTAATTYASLPSAATAGAGTRSFITDCTTTTFLATAAGGGSNSVPVVSNGTNWLVG